MQNYLENILMLMENVGKDLASLRSVKILEDKGLKVSSNTKNQATIDCDFFFFLSSR